LDKRKIRDLFGAINVWKRGDQRAPHKPLLILLALARIARGESREIPYIQIDEPLRNLLMDFGPPRKSYHSEYPFWRLQADGLWEVTGAEGLVARKGNTDPKKSELLKHDVRGGFTKEIYETFKNNPELIREIAASILESHFSESLHQDILMAVGLDLHTVQRTAEARDPRFRDQILTTYGHRCAICGFDLWLDDITLGLEAAHIKWHQAGGPDTPDNGLALCALHHKTFDLGAFTLSLDRAVLVSGRVSGTQGFDEWLLRYHGRPVRPPVNPEYVANSTYIAWHNREVFKGPQRSR